MRIAVIGGGPAGCRISELLARRGAEVTLLDAQGPWEKPCGGGVTAKALALDPAIAASVPQCRIDRVQIFFADRWSVQVTPPSPLAVLSRKELGRHMLAAAERAGAHFLRDRVLRLARESGQWRLETRQSFLNADYIVGADGATSLVRRSVATPFTSSDLHVTMGYFIPMPASPELKIYFVPSLEGYIWSFPRPDHVSYGLITRPAPGWTSRCKSLLWNYALADLGAEVMRDAEFYSAPVPALSPEAWRSNVVAGDGWALVGDAAGLVDAITGEGIYYAVRSAEILADTLPDAGAYRAALAAQCLPDLERASRMYRRFYHGRFLGGKFRKRMVQMAGLSPAIQRLLAELVTGGQSYVGLKRRLARSIPQVLLDMTASPFRKAP